MQGLNYRRNFDGIFRGGIIFLPHFTSFNVLKVLCNNVRNKFFLIFIILCIDYPVNW